jgi:hypothetical protein
VGQRGQTSFAGRLVLDALQNERPVPALERLGDSPRVVRLLGQLFAVALRRCFAGCDVREITAYVRDLLEWLELPARGEFARQTEALIRATLGEPALANEIADARRHEIICWVIGDLARPPGASATVLGALLDQAGQRVDRFDPPSAGQRAHRFDERAAEIGARR